MKSTSFLYVANWKMNMHAQAATEFVDHAKEWIKHHPELKHRIIICPSFPLLLALKIELNQSAIYTGAQNCSEYTHGAYTGQVSAHDLMEVGADFCLVGHSECRILLQESNQTIGNKVTRLFEQKINPIICIGETADEHAHEKTFEALNAQLAPIAQIIKTASSRPNTLIIAYEPVWAIGTGKTPHPQEIKAVIAWILSYAAQHIPDIKKIRIVYGGSIDTNNASQFKEIEGIDGFLIGGASLDFQKFKNIVGLD